MSDIIEPSNTDLSATPEVVQNYIEELYDEIERLRTENAKFRGVLEEISCRHWTHGLWWQEKARAALEVSDD